MIGARRGNPAATTMATSAVPKTVMLYILLILNSKVMFQLLLLCGWALVCTGLRFKCA